MSAIYLIRHGQAHFGSADYDRLTPLGVEQAQVLGRALRERLPRPDAVFCGAMKRQQDTAAHCLAAMDLPPHWSLDAGFDEYDHRQIVDRQVDRAAMNALNAASDRLRAFETLFVSAMQRWQSGAHDAEYAESWTTYRARCLAALARVETTLASSQTAFVFTSGGVIACIAQAVLDFPLERYAAFNWRLANAAVTKLVCGRNGRFVSTLNEHAHFEGAQARLLTYR
jgi:broad specificity phosphatase PhoE